MISFDETGKTIDFWGLLTLHQHLRFLSSLLHSNSRLEKDELLISRHVLSAKRRDLEKGCIRFCIALHLPFLLFSKFVTSFIIPA